MNQQLDPHSAASSLARSHERRALESEALGRALGQILRYWQERDDYVRIKVMELLMVKGWANRDVAAFLKISEQQVANYRFAAVKKENSIRPAPAGKPPEPGGSAYETSRPPSPRPRA